MAGPTGSLRERAEVLTSKTEPPRKIVLPDLVAEEY
jgi:hypothetical protein